MGTNIVFIDSRVTDYQTLIDCLTDPAVVLVLNGQSDGLAQMATQLQGRSGIDAIHIISHGSQGALYLGSTLLNSSNLADYQCQLASIGSALTETGDILLYGCNVAQGDVGLQFIGSLAQATGADVTASEDATGAAAFGGDWVLEESTGSIRSASIASRKYGAILADMTAPTLTSLSIPTSVDVSAGAAGLTIAGTATDDISGVKQLVVYFDKGLSYSSQLGGAFSTHTFLGSYGIYDSWSDGASTQTYGISSTNTSGVYNVTRVDLQDVQGNTRTYTATQLAGMGINTSVNLTGATPDTNAPTLTTLSIPTSVDVSAGAAGLTIAGTATDDISGVKQMVVYFDKGLSYSSQLGGAFSTHTFLGSYGIYDSWSDGASTQTYGISSTNTGGVYNVSHVDLQDVQGNTRTYTATQLAGMGINTSVNLTGATPDTNAPTLTSLTIPTSVNVSGGTAGLTIAGTATDDISGVKQMVVYFDKGLNYSSQLGGAFSTHTFLGSYGIYDSWADGASTQTYGISSTNTSGVYNVSHVDLQDVQGNSRTYTAAQLGGMGINTSVNLIDGVNHVATNNTPTGTVTITGTPTQGQTLTAANTLADADGIPTTGAGAISYQWQADGVDIAGATSSTLVLAQAQVSRAITVVALYTDAQGTTESVASSATSAVTTSDDYADDSAGATALTLGVAKSGSIEVVSDKDYFKLDLLAGQRYLFEMTASGTGSLDTAYLNLYNSSGNNLGSGYGSDLATFSYLASNSDTVYLKASELGDDSTGSYTVKASVVTTNNAPTGTVTITGTATQGQTLTAANTLADTDGIPTTGAGVIGYQWQADGVDIAGATSSTLVLAQAQVSKAITVVARYTDAQGTTESVASSATIAVANTNDAPTGGVTITGTPTQGQTLTAANTLADIDGIPTTGAGAIGYQWQADGVDIAGATGSTLVLTQAQVSKAITVLARYTDAQGTTESVASSATSAVANTNDAPTGSVTISGTATQGQTLTAANTLADIDVIPTTGAGVITYQWQADGVDIAGATGSTVVLTQAQVSKVITVLARYTDAQGTTESVASSATSAVANTNDAPTGSVTISGTPTQGQTLTAANTLADIDGIPTTGAGAIAYQWQADGVDIAGATSSTLALTQTQVSKAITVLARYTDAQGTTESVASSATSAVTNTNDAPTGSVTITGTATQGQTLTAANTLADIDGIPTIGAGAIGYQWQADGVDIAGATSSTVVLTQAQVSKAITVLARYTDAQGTTEYVASSATSAVTNVNDSPTGTVTISGTPTQGQTLTAANTLGDIDGIPTTGAGAIAYQWQADGVDIAGATSSTLVLAQTQVSKAITVLARYTDAQGTIESVASSATASVANTNDNPTGGVTITSTPTQGQTLTAANTLADIDGIPTTGAGAIGYQWQADGVDIAGATGSTLVLTQAQVSKAITVLARYTDAQGTTESVASSATSAVANTNDAPTGSVTISGTATQGQTLTAANTLADIDGIPTTGAGAIAYQWQADGVDIAGATGSTLVLAQAQVSKAITVLARYTDAQGTIESVASSATAAVANTNDAPTGSVTISGTPTQGQTLTAANTLADIDGIPTTGAGAIAYQWQADGVDIAGATSSTLVLSQAQVSRAFTVVARYTDAQGTTESVASSATSAVANTNDAPTGSVIISGTATQGQTLTATNTLADADGIPTTGAGAIAYQWQADGVDIAGATSSTLVLAQAQVSRAITVLARYTDAQGTIESVASSATAAVANTNDAPTGSVTITGTATQGQTLTAANTLADIDGIPTTGAGVIAYQWQADGVDIAGATSSTLVLAQAQVSKVITVLARYTDAQGTIESVASSATAAVANTNDAPTGSVTITGTATQGQTLTATNTLSDVDGPATLPISYQWQANGIDLSGATSATLVLGSDQRGKAITVVAHYTDAQGEDERVTSAATAAVANIPNSPPSLALISLLTDSRIPENTSTVAHIQVANITVTDDTQGSNTLSLIGVDAASFEIIGTALYLKAGVVLDFETQSNYQLAVQVSDASLSATTPAPTPVGFTLTVVNVEEDSPVNPLPNPTPVLPPVSLWPSLPDEDGDGTPELLEAYVKPLDVTGAVAGDGNGDGTADSLQQSVASVPFLSTPTAISSPADAPPVFITLVADSMKGKTNTTAANTSQLHNVEQKDAPANLPSTVKMPLGLISFDAVVGLSGTSGVGVTETFSLYIDSTLGTNGYWKLDASNTWVNLASSVYGGDMATEGGKTRLDFSITDGGQFDADHTVNGTIVDPGAAGFMPLSLVGYAPLLPADGFWF